MRLVWEHRDEHPSEWAANELIAKKLGIPVARCTVERLMRQLGLRGVVRGQTSIRTMTGDEPSEPPLDCGPVPKGVRLQETRGGSAPRRPQHAKWISRVTPVG